MTRLVSAPIRLFIFSNRIEIISPGHLPNNLTVEKIRTGNSNIRNPILVSYAAKGLLPYHGLGSGVKRALEEWPNIDFLDDPEGCLFTATVHRDLKGQGGTGNALGGSESGDNEPTTDKLSEVGDLSGQNLPNSDPSNDLIKEDGDLLNAIRTNPGADYSTLGRLVGSSEATVKRHIQRLKSYHIVKRIGSKKTGHWEVRRLPDSEQGAA